eukprot:jgi/Orpsp1_1/1189904/evm.model.d7180000075388.1
MKIMTSGIANKLDNIKIDEKCKVCSCSKLKNFPYHPSKNKTSEIFEVIHMDTVYSADTSIHGNKYFFTILDDYSRYGWVFFIKNKSEVFSTFIKWYKRIKNIFNKNIKYIKTDNGTEYNNVNFNNFCDDNGIIHLYSIPYNPQQNGKAERFQQTLIFSARAMLQDAQLHHKFWEDAIDTANYIHNRLPHKGNNNKVPFEVLNNKKVDYSKLRVFGCQAFYFIPKQFRDKFANSTFSEIFLGYDTNPSAYRIYDPSNNKIILSKAVVFFEDYPANLSAPSSPPDIYNFLPYNEIGGKCKPSEPINFKDIYNKEDKDDWIDAVNNELNSMKNLNVFTILKNVPKGINIVTPKWVFKYKYDDKGNIIKRKARLVARGFTQQEGIDYKETFSPTLRQNSLRILTAIAAINNYDIYQIDIKTAYLNAKLDENIYMYAPEGHEMYRKGILKLNKALYGLKQSSRMWNEELNNTLKELNFIRLISEPCLYVKKNKYNNIICLLGVYVDDILITGTHIEIKKVKESIQNKYKLNDLGQANFIIGIKIVKCSDGYIIHQKGFLDEILRKFNANNLKPSNNTIPNEIKDLKNKKFNSTIYKQAIGSLLYLAINTRPDILFSVSKAASKNENPTYEEWNNVLKIFRYLKGNPNYGIKYTRNNNKLKIYVDADFAGDKETRKSTSGHVVLIGSGPTSWYSKAQHCISLSTAESEYYSLVECAKECLWYKNLFKELNLNYSDIIINVDNQAAIFNAKNETINPKSRHIDLRYHKVRELVKNKTIKLEYIKSEDNLAEGFTKYLNSSLMTKFRNELLTKV